MIAEKVARMGWELLSHPSYSPDSTHLYGHWKKYIPVNFRMIFVYVSVLYFVCSHLWPLCFSPRCICGCRGIWPSTRHCR